MSDYTGEVKEEMNQVHKIVFRLVEAKEKYYSGEPLISDVEFDALEDKLRELAPNHPYFNMVGSDDTVLDKIVHKVPMLSMGKAKTIEEVLKWIEKVGLKRQNDVLVEPKLDGISASCVYDNGKLVYIATRGNGKEGQNITHIKKYISSIPKTINTQKHIEIRGELYIPKNNGKYTDRLRNICAGLINRKEDNEDLKYVKFVAYQNLQSDSILEFTMIRELEELGFFVPDTTPATSDRLNELYNNYLSTYRDKWEYETDGLVLIVNDRTWHEKLDSQWVVEHHHHYNLAWKPPAKFETSVIKNVIWQMSRHGNLIPVVEFNPIVIDGVTIERATLNNYENVVKLKIAIGCSIAISRANDVIPFVNEVISEKLEESIIPKYCPHCKTELEVEGVHLHCSNKKCSEQIIQKIIFWVRKSEMDGVSEQTVRKLNEEGYLSNIIDLYNLKESIITGIDGFAESKTKNLLNQIQKSKSLTAQEFISKLGIPLVGRRALKKLGIETIEDFNKFNDDTYVIGRTIILWKENKDNTEMLSELLKVLDIKENAVKNVNSKRVCMTGKGHAGRKKLIKEIEDRGDEFSSSITKDLDILICEDVNGNSSKLQKARKAGIQLMAYEEYFK